MEVGLRAVRQRAIVFAATGLCLALGACQVDGTDIEGTNLSRPVVALNGSAMSTTTAPVSMTAEAQAYSQTETSKVEASVEAVAAGRGSQPSQKYSLFKSTKQGSAHNGERRTPRTKGLFAKNTARPRTHAGGNGKRLAALPGVRTQTAFEGVRSFGRDATKKAKALAGPVRLASAAALARIGKHGLRTQHSKVSVGCLKPELVTLIKRAERHFGRHAVVTSGYRSPRHNRRVGGARNSMHVTCKAADVQIKGVTKWKLATWFRRQRDRGGVGTYCHTASVHIDTGKQRDWNWRCKRRRGKRA